LGDPEQRAGRNVSFTLPTEQETKDGAASQSADTMVFVVDDDASVRESLSSLFRSVGLRVELFSSAQAFLKHQRPNAPACLVLDVRLPA